MQKLSPRELLDVWERGSTQRPHERAHTILAAALHDQPEAALDDLSVGRRDSLLLDVRELTFGPTLDAVVACGRCGERLERRFGPDEVRAQTPADGPATAEVVAGGWCVRIRPPSARDLAAAADAGGAAEARAVLLERCVVEAIEGELPRPVADLPAKVLEAIEARMAELDPQADVRLAMSCPACGERWDEALDIAAFLWSEIDAWAPRALRDVHVLASAYGWSEADILALGPRRLAAYLEMAKPTVGPWATS
jgi:hypothetical protein